MRTVDNFLLFATFCGICGTSGDSLISLPDATDMGTVGVWDREGLSFQQYRLEQSLPYICVIIGIMLLFGELLMRAVFLYM